MENKQKELEEDLQAYKEFEEEYKELLGTSAYSYYAFNAGINRAIDTKEQEAIEFAEWVDTNGWINLKSAGWWGKNSSERAIDTAELYKKFIQWKTQKEIK